MKAVGFLSSKPVSDPDCLQVFDLPEPDLRPTDLRVAVEAVSVNPADAKVRQRTAPDAPLDAPRILGFDAVGIVEAVGADVTGFRTGDRVWYAGDASRQGSNAELQAVDHRIAALAPTSVSPEAAASLPLVSLTAWEMLFDRLQVPTGNRPGTLLVIGGAGGVGSITLQLARRLTCLDLVATASRKESADWCREMGAHATVDHRDLLAAYRASGRNYAGFIAQYADLSQHWAAMCELVAPQGRIGTIVETPDRIDISALQAKSAALMWELMFTRSAFGTPDMAEQGRILFRVARLVDDGVIRTIDTDLRHGLTAETFRAAHETVEIGAMIGKLVVKY
ncbi:zinc-binding alcohol dehydrogenase family protein [Oceanomicrobium pacificus]|nr:zinc-binding alcohol dehydrogenase family protein [Oceanomicrobium pacificus]